MLAQPPFDLAVLAFTGLVPFALLVHGSGPSPRGRRAALRGALIFGLVHFGLTLYWMPLVVARLSWALMPGYLAVVAGLTAVAVLVGWLLHTGLHRTGLPLWAALPVAWTAGEWLRAHLPAPLAFPWLELGVSLAPYPELAGWAEVVGTRGLGAWMALVNGLCAEAILAYRAAEGRRSWRRPLVAAVLVTALPMGWGLWRARTLTLLPTEPVAVVQPGVGAETRADPEVGWSATVRALDRLLAGLEPASATLVVLPEVVLRGYPETPEGRAAMGSLYRQARSLDTPLVFGALGRSPDGGERYNSAFLVEPDGLAPFRYDKRRLVPGVERVPLGVAARLPFVPDPGSFDAGGEASLLEVAGVRYGVLICYEAIYDDLARGYRRAGADVLLNLTNDGWFGGEPGWARTTALWQHPAHLVMRAIENRMGVARSAATGISLFVDPVGRVHQATPLFRPALRVGDPGTTGVRTVYTRFGDLAGAVAALLALAVALSALRPGVGGRSGRRSLDPPGRRH